MSLIDDVIVNAAAAVEGLTKAATDVVDRSKVRVSSAELKSKISSQFEILGRYVYDTTVAGTTDQAVVGEYVNNITVLINELKSLQDSVTADCGRVICPKCGCKNSVDSLFCKRCGASLDFANSYTAPKAENACACSCEAKAEEAPAPVAEPVQEDAPAPVPEVEAEPTDSSAE